MTGSGPLTSQDSRLGALTALIVGLAMIALRGSSFGRSHSAELEAGRVAWVDGSIVVRSIGGDGDDLYFYRIAGHEFQTTEDGAKAIEPAVTYRVYYVPGSELMVNIEPLR